MRNVSVAVVFVLLVGCSGGPVGQPASTGVVSQALSAAQCNYFKVDGKVQICHATGSLKNPYTLVKVSENACIDSHAAHPHDYISVNDPTCAGKGFLPAGAPCEGSEQAPVGVPCTTGYSCQGGLCKPTDKCLGVTCNAADVCHYAYCDPNTGACVSEPTTGNTCDDAQACTLTDLCRAGACTGGDSTCGMSIVVAPATPRTDDNVSASLNIVLAADLTASWTWTNLASHAVVSGATLPAAATTKGDKWSVTVVVSAPNGNRATASGEVTIVNTPPVVAGATLGSSEPRPTRLSTLTCAAAGAGDADSDPLVIRYAWFVDGVEVPGATSSVLAKAFVKGQSVTCTVTVHDGTNSPYASATSSPLAVLSALPAIAGASVNGQGACAPWTCVPHDVSDADGDPVSVLYRWFVGGVEVQGATAQALPPGSAAGGQSVACAARGDDGTIENGVTLAGAEVQSPAVMAIDAPPVVTSATLPVTAHPGDVLTCAGAATDDCVQSPALTFAWSVNGNAVATGPTFGTGALNPGDRVVCTVTASDGHETSSLASNATTLVNQPPRATAVLTSSGPAPTVLSTFTCTAQGAVDPDGDLFTTTFAWQVNGQPVQGASGPTLSAGYTRSQAVACSIVLADKWSQATSSSNAIVVQDSLPTVASATLQHSSRDVCGPWLCVAAGAADVDADPVQLHYQWFINGKLVQSGTQPQLAPNTLHADEAGFEVSCAAAGTDGSLDGNGQLAIGAYTASEVETTVQHPPQLSYSQAPWTAHLGRTLACDVTAVDSCGLPVTFAWSWVRNGVTVPGATDSTFDTGPLHVGDVIACDAVASNGALTSTAHQVQPTTMTDSPPTIASVLVTSPDPRPTLLSTLTCSASGISDAENDLVTTTYAWQVNGVTLPGATGNTLSAAFVKGNTVTCSATAADKWLATTMASNTVTILSMLPTVASATVSGAGVCTPLSCVTSGVTDADGDEVTLHYRWFVDGNDVGNDLPALPAGHHPGQSFACAAFGDDGTSENGVQLFGPAATSPTIIGVANTPRVTTDQITPAGQAHVGDVLTCAGQMAADCGSSPQLTFTWKVNGAQAATQTVGGVSASVTFSTALLHVGDAVACDVTASDLGVTSITATSNTVVITATTWNLAANVANASAGRSVAVIDDLDGDGRREVAIGAPNTSANGLGHTGAVYVVTGSNLITDTSLADVIAGQGGLYVAGDHGNFDLPRLACKPGKSYGNGVVCGAATDVGNLVDYINGPNGGGLGWALAYAGDVDGDGKGDLVATTPWDQVSRVWTGRSWVLSGGSLLSDPFGAAAFGVAGFVFDGECGRRPENDDQFLTESISNGDISGFSAIPIGDANGDGLGDFAVSAPNNGDADEGTVYVVFGRTDGQGVNASDLFQRGCNGERLTAAGPESGTSGYAAYRPNINITGNQGPQWGVHLHPAGDFNGDGYDDFILPPFAGSGSNSTWVLLGAAKPGPQAILTRSLASEWEIQLGNWNCPGGVCNGLNGGTFPADGGGGDVNGDGFDDLGFLMQDFDTRSFLGVLYGRADEDGLINLADARTAAKGFEVGWGTGSIQYNSNSLGVMRIIGDINGDGYDDVAYGSPLQQNSAGKVFVVFGAATAPAGLTYDKLQAGNGGFIVAPGNAGERFGASLASGDIDGDGLVDLVVGAPSATGLNGEPNAGRVQVVFGHDFNHGLAFLGSAANDAYTGDAGANSIVGGRGNDTLKGGGGKDAIYGGAGDDSIEVGDDSFLRVDGGPGNDTLVLAGSATGLTLKGGNRRRIHEIERIRLGGQTVSLSKLGVAPIASAGHRLKIFGTGQVTISASDHWKKTGTVNDGDGNTYLTLADGVVQLWLASTLTTFIPPTIFDGPVTIKENTAAGVTAATIASTDPDGDDGQLVYQLISDSSGAFALDAGGALRVVSPGPLDYEAGVWPWKLVVKVTDQTGLSTMATIAVSLSDQPEAPSFPNGAQHWSAPESWDSNAGPLGNVQAVDPDQGEVITYALLNDFGLFQIDPVSGDISLQIGKLFNYVQTPSYTLTVTATDKTNLKATATVVLDVIGQNPLTRSAHVTFELRNWSIYGDTTALNGQPTTIPALTNQQVKNPCGGPGASTSTYNESWTPSNAFVAPLPISFQAQYSGQICTSADFKYNVGTWNATVPFDVEFSYPETVTPGQTFTLNSTATPSYAGGALWGTTSGFDMSMNMQFVNFGMFVKYCQGNCTTIVNKQNINAQYAPHFAFPPVNWKATPLADPNRFGFAMGSPVASSSKGFSLSADSLANSVFQALGLPANKGQSITPIPQAHLELVADYTLLHTETGLSAAADWNLGLDVNGITGTLITENLKIIHFTVGTPVQITLPQAADLNHDGRVDVDIRLALDSKFHNTWNHSEQVGFSYAAGVANMKVTGDVNPKTVYARRTLGPAMGMECTPLGPQTEIEPTNCVSTSSTSQFDYTPTGFSKPEIIGGFHFTP